MLAFLKTVLLECDVRATEEWRTLFNPSHTSSFSLTLFALSLRSDRIM